MYKQIQVTRNAPCHGKINWTNFRWCRLRSYLKTKYIKLNSPFFPYFTGRSDETFKYVKTTANIRMISRKKWREYNNLLHLAVSNLRTLRSKYTKLQEKFYSLLNGCSGNFIKQHFRVESATSKPGYFNCMLILLSHLWLCLRNHYFIWAYTSR